MTSGNDSLALDDEDRLPWLEPAYDEDDDDEVSAGRLVMFIIAGLALLGLIVGGVYLIRNSIADQDDPQLIAAPNEDYKIPAEDADAKKFEGEGDASFAASEGVERGGRIDPSRLPETPITAQRANGTDKPGVASASSTVTAPVADRTGKSVPPGTTAAVKTARGPMIQLGAYESEAIAKESWTRLAKRFDYIASLTYHIQPVTVGGTKFYRLRAAAGGDAGTLCGRLKVAGENCIVVQ